MPSQKITFKGSSGEMLSAKLDSPQGETKSYALFAHCFTCGKDLSTINRISKALNDRGIALFRFDFTGLGLSKGEFANTNFSSNVEDLILAEKFMEENLEAPDIMIGHSLGGAATLVAAAQSPKTKAVAVIGAPSNATNVLKQFGGDLAEINEKGEANVKLAGRPFKIKKQFIEDAKAQNVLDIVANMKKALLILHSPIDETVSISHAKEIYEAAKHPKSFISLDKADHLLLKKPEYSQYVADMIAIWAGQYVNKKFFKIF